MSNTKLNEFFQYGTHAERLAFTPDPAIGVQQLYQWFETDTDDLYIYTTAWKGPFRPGGARAASILSPDKDPGTLGSEDHKQVSIASGATQTILSMVSGSGYISSIFLTSNTAPTNVEVIVTVDGEGTPSIDLSLADLLGAHYLGTASASSFANRWIVASNVTGFPGGEFKIPIPFASSVKIEVKNNSGGSISIWSIAKYHTGVSDDFTYTQHLHAASVNVSGISIDTETDLLNVSTPKAGVLAGIGWTYDGYPGGASPRTGPLEGAFKIYVDGSASPSYKSSGSEDFFGMSYYFTNFSPQLAAGGDVVMTFKTSNTYGAQRFFTLDPVKFSSGLRVSWTAGNSSYNPFTGTATLFGTVWYYTQN